jgi:hypothetical protein
MSKADPRWGHESITEELMHNVEELGQSGWTQQVRAAENSCWRDTNLDIPRSEIVQGMSEEDTDES